MHINFCRWLDSDRGPLELEANALPTEPQPLPSCFRFVYLELSELYRNWNISSRITIKEQRFRDWPQGWKTFILWILKFIKRIWDLISHLLKRCLIRQKTTKKTISARLKDFRCRVVLNSQFPKCHWFKWKTGPNTASI